jgi:hypothetical protein
MTRKPYPTDVHDQTQSILSVWHSIDPALNLGQVTQAAMQADLDKSLALQAQMTLLEDQLTELRNQRDVLHAAMWDKIKRVRAGMKSIYGDDSSEYKRVGGTRMSERARPQRAAAQGQAPTPAPTP